MGHSEVRVVIKNLFRGLLLGLGLLAATVTPGRAQTNAVETYISSLTGPNTIVATTVIPGIAALSDLTGVPIRFNGTGANTTAVTYNQNGLGGVAVKKPTRGGLAALTGGEIQPQLTELVYDGVEFVCTTCTNTYKLPTYTLLTSGSTATYTTPAGATHLDIRQIGGGGGGGPGSGGGNGGTTTFGSTTTEGGGGASAGTTPGVGGSGGTTGTGTQVIRQNGGYGNGGGSAVQGGVSFEVVIPGGAGCVSQFASSPPAVNGTATPAVVPNTGSGGYGAFIQSLAGAGTYNAGAGGGCGEYAEYYINTPAATYTYTIGAAGAAGGAGASAGSAGLILVKESYN